MGEKAEGGERNRHHIVKEGPEKILLDGSERHARMP